MIARLRSWWSGRSRIERLIFAVGIPAVAVAALWGNLRERGAPVGLGLEAEGGEASALSPAVGAPAVLNAGAPGVGFDQLAGFSEVFTSEIGELQGRLGVIEGPAFADSPAIAAVRSQFQTGLGTLEDELRAEIARAAEAKTVNQPPSARPAPTPTPKRYLPLSEANIRALFADYPQCFKPANGATYWVNGFLGRGTPGVDAAAPEEWPDFWRAYACTGLPR